VPPTFKRRFQPGDVLFHSRNLKKIAVPDFGGITGEKLFVLRSRSPALLQEFVPYVLLSPVFAAYAEASWSGSVNKFLNWTPLARYEFDLPPFEDQRRLAGLLRAAQCVAEASEAVGEEVGSVASALFEEASYGANRVPIRQVVTGCNYGCSLRATADGEGLPIIRIPNVLRGELDLTDLKYVTVSEAEERRFRVVEGDVLLVRTNGNPDYVGRCVVVPFLSTSHIFASYLIRLMPDREKIIPAFLSDAMNSQETRKALRGAVRSSAGNYNINTKGILSATIPLLPVETQRRYLDQSFAIRRTTQAVASRKSMLQAIVRKVLAETPQ
jgi:restriction endonuclease S subunit